MGLLTGDGFKGDKTFPLIILLAKWVYQLVYSYKEIGVSVLMQLFLIGWSPPLPTSIEAPAKVSGWWDGQHRGNHGKLKNILH
jgi:hypothetical protein